MRRLRQARDPLGLGIYVLTLLVAFVVSASGTAAASGQEYAVKAALVFNFMKFVDWPPPALVPGGALVVGLLSGSRIPEFERAFAGKDVKGRPIVVQAFRGAREVRDCHVLFVAADVQAQLPEVLRAVQARPVLTVSEVLNAQQADAVINLVANDTRIGFQVNLEAAQEAGLRISSRLLSLASAVRGDARQGGHP